jgi:cardiolipin synthase (CMP-forming)
VRIFDIGGPAELSAETDRLLTVPNVLSLARIALVPFVYFDLTAGRLTRALVLLVVIGATDWFDGYLARVLSQRTRLGAVLDPIGDRAVLIVVGIGLVASGILPLWALVLLLVREVAVVLVGLVLLATGSSIPPTSRLGKVATAGLLLTVPAFVAAHAFGGPQGPLPWLLGMAWFGFTVNLTLTYLATLGYARASLEARR